MKLVILLASLSLITTLEGSKDVKIVLFDKNGERSEMAGDTCAAGLLFNEGDGESFTCACVTGVWAFYGLFCTRPVSIVAGSNFCFKIPRGKISQISLLSSTKSTFTSTLTLMTLGLEQVKDKVNRDSAVNWNMQRSSFVSTSESSWELKSSNGKSYCLRPEPDADSYCTFLKLNGLENTNVTKVKRECTSPNSILVEPYYCARFHRGSYRDERVCDSEEYPETLMLPYDLIDSLEDANNLAKEDTHSSHFYKKKIQKVVNRYKRQANATAAAPPGAGAAPPAAGAAPGAGAPPAAGAPAGANSTAGAAAAAAVAAANNQGATEDEDYVDPAQASVVNHPLILQQLRAYLDAQISGSTGSSTPYQTNTRGIPAFILLEKSLDIMVRTCGEVVQGSYFTLAFNAFTNIQTQSYHVKEPYLSQPAYLRIQSALNQCFLDAKQHNFVGNMSASPPLGNTTVGNSTAGNSTNNNSTDPNTCEGIVEKQATNTTMKNNMVFNLSISDDKRGRGYEPIVETVWKIMLNAHSYCYKYFSDYYNDHHTFTVALLPLFTNEIQNIWMNVSVINGTYVEPQPGLLLYGGIIGDHNKMIDNMDLCVAASRIGSAYPWLMNRPPIDETNKWSRRRRRSVSGGPTCLRSNEDSRVTFKEMGLGRCE